MDRTSPLTTLISAGLRGAALALLAGNAWAQYAVSQSPPLSPAPLTNVSILMDDSGSMQWAYVPDGYGSCTGTRRFNAPSFNGLAYNPNTVYQSPQVINNQGQTKTLTTCFSPSLTVAQGYAHCTGTGAWIDGFNQPINQAPTQGANSAEITIDLTTGYQPTASYAPGSTGQTFSPHPYQDLTTIFSTPNPPAGAASGGVGSCSNSGSATSGGGGGNQFGPATGTNTATGAPAYFYQYSPTAINSNGATCGNLTLTTSTPNDDACYVYVKVVSSQVSALDIDGSTIDGLQNFANWYSFYRTRHLMIASAAANGMMDTKLQQARVTWRALNSCTDMVGGPNGPNPCQGWDNYTVDNLLRTFNDTPVSTGNYSQRAAFYHWLTHIPAASPTPTRSSWAYIGDYFSAPTAGNSAFGTSDPGANGPYGINPNPAGTTQSATASSEVACVQNFNMTLTDGQWNQDNNGTFFGTADATATTLPMNPPLPTNPVNYSPTQKTPASTLIYGNDPNRDTLSDVAFHYWATNLRPDLANSVTALTPYYPVTSGLKGAVNQAVDFWDPRNDPATWPHLVQFTIGIGMTRTMTQSGLPWWGNDPTAQYTQPGYLNLLSGANAWPVINNTAMQGDIGKAYDLWHAALNSRGLAFSADSAGDLVTAIHDSLARVGATMNPQTAIAVNSTSLANNAIAYVASYSSKDWHGTLQALSIASNGTVNTASPIWNTDAGSGAPANAFASYTNRIVLTSTTAAEQTSPLAAPTGTTLAVIPFTYYSSGTTVSPIWTNVTSANADVVNWLLGYQGKEVPAPGVYRARPISILGDIVDAAPAFTYQENFGYAALPEGTAATPNYLAFLTGTKNYTAGNIYSGAGMVYVGADDGMMHGFDAGSGEEVFAYVPHAVIANMPALSSTGYTHQFYVDQTAYVGDACLNGTGLNNAGCTWKTVLVGTTGAGGQGVFALDVTKPADMESLSTATPHVLWDLDGTAAAGASATTDAAGDPDLGYPIGKPMVARLNNGKWAAIFGNGYLSKNGCAVLFIVQLDSGAITKIGTTGAAGTTVCTSLNINASNGLGPVTLYDANGDMTTDYVYAGDLAGNLWKFDLHTSTLPTAPALGFGNPLFAGPGASGSCFAPAPPTPGTNTCQSITSAPALGPALTGLVGTMVYFGTGRIFAIGDTTTTTQQAFYAVLDQNTAVSQSQLVQQTITETQSSRTVSNNAVSSPSMGWYMNFFDMGERMTVAPVLFNGYVIFATEVPSSSTCSVGGTGWIMAVSANSPPGGQNGFFLNTPGVNGIPSTVGVVEGLTVMSSATPGQSTVMVSGTNGVQPTPTAMNSVKGRISWHELVR